MQRAPETTPAAAAPRRAGPTTRAILAGPAVAATTLAIALVVTGAAGVPLRDPGGVSRGRFLSALAVLAIVALIDALVRGRGHARWPRRRLVAVAAALVSFYATYLAYRNLKSVVPLLRPDELFDRQLTEIDRDVFLGNPPGEALHSLLGTGISAHVLAAVYMAFFLFIPVALAAALVLARDTQAGLYFTTALSLNWLLAAGCYFLLPSLGPFAETPQVFADLPATSVSRLEAALSAERALFLHDPAAPGAAQSIGAFASLHVSIWVTAALGCHLLGARRAVTTTVWGLTVLTVLATLYFGWHYVLDDVAGVVIALTALALAGAITAYDPRGARARRREALPSPAVEPA
ncbi:MAG TPA: phosphatase PAP2 family protein [Solirubrobacteraceae bacterium]